MISAVLARTLLDAQNLLEHKKVPYEFFSPVRQKKFDGQSWKLSVICNNSRHQKFTETEKSSTREIFGTLSQKIFDGKLWHTPLMHKFFPDQKLFETPKDSFEKFFGNLRQRISDGNSWYSILPPFAPPPSPLVLIIPSDTPKFLEQRTPLRKIPVMSNSISSTGSRYTPSFLHSPS